MNFASGRFFGWFLLPATLAVLAAWYQSGVLARREAGLAKEAAGLREELRREGFSPTAEEMRQRIGRVRADEAWLRELADAGRGLAGHPVVRDHAGRPFQLIEFERERASAAFAAREKATAAGVTLDASAFGVLADTSESPARPDWRWAQLAMASEAAARAIAAKVSGYEALPVPAVRRIRMEKNSPVLADEILFSARVTGESAAVQAFVEGLVSGGEGGIRFFLEHLVLRKDGIATPDRASATVVFAALLPPQNEGATP